MELNRTNMDIDEEQRGVDIGKLLEQICEGAIPQDVDDYKTIRDMIQHMKEQKLLKDSVNDLLEELAITNQAGIEKFLKMRVALRCKVFEKRGPIKIDQINIKQIDWDKVCQLLEEHVKPDGRQQRLKWYKYIEESQITGTLLKEEKRSKEIMKVLNLNMGQTESFKKLVKELRGGEDEDSGKSGVTMTNSVTGKIIVGGTDEQKGDIHVAHTIYGDVPKKKKGQEQQSEETDGN